MTVYELLSENSSPSEEEIRQHLSGNLCRCTGYQNIVAAVMWAAERLRANSELMAYCVEISSVRIYVTFKFWRPFVIKVLA